MLRSRWAHLAGVRRAGKAVHYAAVKRDVTLETRLDQQLFEAQKTEAVGRLAGAAGDRGGRRAGNPAGGRTRSALVRNVRESLDEA